MSDEDRDIDIESDEEDQVSIASSANIRSDQQFTSRAEKRAHHNALERKRRDHMKDSFSLLRSHVPTLQDDKASRAQILKKTADYIKFMKEKNEANKNDVSYLKEFNAALEKRIRVFEKRKSPGNFAAMSNSSLEDNSLSDEAEIFVDISDFCKTPKPKKLKC